MLFLYARWHDLYGSSQLYNSMNLYQNELKNNASIGYSRLKCCYRKTPKYEGSKKWQNSFLSHAMVQGRCFRSADSAAPSLIQGTDVMISGFQVHSSNKSRARDILQGKWSKDDTHLSLFHSSGKNLNTRPHLAAREAGKCSPRLDPDGTPLLRKRGE